MTRRTLLAALVLCALGLSQPPLAQAIPPSATFDGAASVLDPGSTPLSNPAGVAFDTFGNTYIADSGNNRIVKAAADGTVAVLAINGLGAALNDPEAIATDSSGNIYIADSGNSRVVKVTSSGAGSVVNTGGLISSGSRGVVVDSSGNIYVADATNNRVVQVTAGGTAAIFAITGLGTPLNAPGGLAVDTAGNLYIADTGNNRIVKVTAAGAASVLSFGGLTLSSPRGLAVDSFNTVYVADSGNNRLVSGASNLTVNTPGITPNAPRGIAVDPFGTLYCADTGNNQVDMIAVSAVDFGKRAVGVAAGNSRTLSFTIFGTLGALSPMTMGAPNGDFSVVSGAGTTCTSGTTSTSCTVQLQLSPHAAGLTRGSLALVGNASNTLLIVPLFGVGIAPTVSITPAKASVLPVPGITTSFPFQMSLDGSGNKYVANYVQCGGCPQLVKVTADGSSASAVSTGSVTLGPSITGLVLDGAGQIYIGDYYNSRIVRVDTTGNGVALSISAGAVALGQPTELAMDAGGNLIISDYSRARIVKVPAASLATTATSLTGVVVPTPGQTFTAASVSGVAVDAYGNIYISNRHKVVKATPIGAAADLPTPGVTLSVPQGVTVDGGGNLYIIDTNRIVQVSAAGAASVVQFAGLTAPTTLSGSGYGVTVDAAGSVYIPDWTNSRLLKLDTSSPAPLVFGTARFGQTSSDSPKTLTVQNVGNFPLTLPVPASGNNPSFSTSDFALGNVGTCPQVSSVSAPGVLAPAAACTLAVAFTPAGAGARAANLVLTDNTANAASPGYASQSIALSGTGTQAVTVITWNVPAAITYGTALGATQLNATASAPGIMTYTPPAGTVPPVGVNTLSVAFAPTDAVDYTNATATTTVTVNKAATSVAVSASASSGTSVTITATVTSSYGTPDGTVQFSVGSTDVGSVALDGTGKATIVVPSSNATVTATYSGSANYVASTGSGAAKIDPGYTVSANLSAIAIHIGESADVQLNFAPVGGFTGQVDLSCQGLPASMSCNFTPASFVADGSNQQQSGQLRINAPGAAGVATSNFAGLLILPGVFFGGILNWRRRTRASNVRRLVAWALLAGLGATVGCSSGHYDRVAATVVVTVSAVDNGTAHTQVQGIHSLNLTITVSP